MSSNDFESMYEHELDAISRALTVLHPIGHIKAIGMLEAVTAFAEWLEISLERGDKPDDIRKAIAILRTRKPVCLVVDDLPPEDVREKQNRPYIHELAKRCAEDTTTDF